MSAGRSETTDRLLTGDDLLALGDIGPCELVDGRIVPMSPTGGEHGAIEARLIAALVGFVRGRKLGQVMGGEVGIYTRRSPDRVRGADVAFWSKARIPGRVTRKFVDVAPELAVEILSPDDRWNDLRQKIEEYFAIGVDRVWIVDPEGRSVEVFETATRSRRLAETELLRGQGVLEGFELPVGELFAE